MSEEEPKQVAEYDAEAMKAQMGGGVWRQKCNLRTVGVPAMGWSHHLEILEMKTSLRKAVER